MSQYGMLSKSCSDVGTGTLSFLTMPGSFSATSRKLSIVPIANATIITRQNSRSKDFEAIMYWFSRTLSKEINKSVNATPVLVQTIVRRPPNDQKTKCAFLPK